MVDFATLASPHKARVVVIDDDPAFCAVLAYVAGSQGFIFRCYASLAELDPAALQDADLLVVDYDLGDVTGLEIGRALARCNPRVPVLLVSAHSAATKTADWPDNIRSFASKSLGPFGVLDAIRGVLAARSTGVAGADCAASHPNP